MPLNIQRWSSVFEIIFQTIRHSFKRRLPPVAVRLHFADIPLNESCGGESPPLDDMDKLMKMDIYPAGGMWKEIVRVFVGYTVKIAIKKVAKSGIPQLLKIGRGKAVHNYEI